MKEINNQKTMAVLDSEMDHETLQLLEENERIIENAIRPQLSPEERRAKVDSIYDKLQEIFARARAQTASSVETFESVEEAQPNNEKEDETMMTETGTTEFATETTPTGQTDTPTPAAVLCLRNIRESRGWNQKQAAEKLGISQGLVSQVESGRTPMSKKLRAKLESLGPTKAA